MMWFQLFQIIKGFHITNNEPFIKIIASTNYIYIIYILYIYILYINLHKL